MYLEGVLELWRKPVNRRVCCVESGLPDLDTV
jgi:hypothetical protein